MSEHFSGQANRALLEQVLKMVMSKLDVVPREEFDIQCQVLQKTRKKITELEARIKQLESTQAK